MAVSLRLRDWIIQSTANQVAFLKLYYEIRPVSQDHWLNPPSFVVNLQSDVFTDLSKKLYLRIRILNTNGSSLGMESHVTSVSLMFHALF